MRPAFSAKSGSRGKIQLRWHQGRMASSESHRQTVVSPTDATMPRSTAACWMSAMLKRDRGRPCSWGSSHARALIAITTPGGKAGSSVARPRFQTGDAFLIKALSPLADDLSGGIEPCRNLIVIEAFRCVQDRFGPDDIAIR